MLPRRLLSILVSLLLAGCATTPLERDRALIHMGHTREGLAQLASDAQKSPQNVALRQYYYLARQKAVTRWLAEARTAISKGDLKTARAKLDDVDAADPHNADAAALRDAMNAGQVQDPALAAAKAALAARQYDAAEHDLAPLLKRTPPDAAAQALEVEIEAQRKKAQEAVVLDPVYAKEKVGAEFQNAPLRSVFDALSRQSGLNFVFAPGVPLDRPVTLFAKDTTIATAVTMLVEGNGLKQHLIDPHTLLIAPPAPPPEALPTGNGQEVHAFYLTNANAKQVAGLLQSMTTLKSLYVDPNLNLILVRGKPAQIATASKLIQLVDLAQPEVMLDVEVLEVSSDLVRNLGIQYPNQFTLLNVPPSASSVTTPTGTTVTTPSTTPLTVESLMHISPSKIAINNPALNLQDDLGNVKLLANPQIRVKNHDNAHIQIGEKVPVFTSNTTPTGVVSNSVSYLDVGLKLNVTPSVLLDNNVQINLSLEVSSILNEVNNNGTLAYQIGTRNAETTLRLANGETQILAGLISDQDRSTANRFPGLGEIPLLGRLFSNHLDSRNRTEIILLITPHVLRNLNLAQAGAKTFAVGEGSVAVAATPPYTPPRPVSAPQPPMAPAPRPASMPSTGQPTPQNFRLPPGFKLPPGVKLPPGMQTSQ